MDALPPQVAAAFAPPISVAQAWIMATLSLAALAWCAWRFVDAVRRDRAAAAAILADDEPAYSGDTIVGRHAPIIDLSKVRHVGQIRAVDEQAQRLTQEGRL